MKKIITLLLLCFLGGAQMQAQNCKPDFVINKKSSKQINLNGFIKDSTQQSNVSYTWYVDFDNNQANTLTGQTATYTYSANGTYRILLSINRDNSCFDTTSKYIVIKDNMAPKAELDRFNMPPNTNTSVFYPAKNDRDDDGQLDFNSIQIVQAPKFGSYELLNGGALRYTKGETFRGADTLKYTIKDMEGATSNPTFIYIQAAPPAECVVSFQFQKDTSGNTVYFINKSSQNIVYYTWNFGDGNSSNLKNPSHTYANDGEYKVKLFGSDSMQQCFKTYEAIVKIGSPGPKCEVAFQAEFLKEGYGVKFHPAASANIKNFYWDFGDGKQSNLKDPTHYYDKPGQYNVCLTGVDSVGKCQKTFCKIIQVGQNTKNCTSKFQFKFHRDGDSSDLRLVSFFNNSYGDSLQYNWTFGDGKTSQDKNPIHQYEKDGMYEACLIVYNSKCEDKFCAKIYIGKEKASISGLVFLDENANGKRDEGEKGLEGQTVVISPKGMKVVTNAGGYYKAILDSGSYTVSVVVPKNFNQTSPQQPPVYNVEVMNSGHTQGLNFGLKPESKVKDLKVKITAFRKKDNNGKPIRYQILYKNAGSDLMSGYVLLNYDAKLIFKKSDSAKFDKNESTRTIKWTFQNLKPGEHKRIKIGFDLSQDAKEGDTIVSRVSVMPNENDATPENNQSTVCTILGGEVNHQDMDDKDCDGVDGRKKGMSVYNTIPYTIRFQNLGSATVNDMVVYDTLSVGLDASSFIIKDMSHDFSVTLLEGNVLMFALKDINLVPAKLDEEASQGFISFYIDPNGSTQTVSNTAFIYFDDNEGLSTNTTITVAEISTGVVSATRNTVDVKVYPNPLNTTATVKLINAGNDAFEFSLMDINGKVVKSMLSNAGSELILQKDGLLSGMYFYQIITESGLTHTGKILVQ